MRRSYFILLAIDCIVVCALCVIQQEWSILFVVLGLMFAIASFRTKHMIEETEKLHRKEEWYDSKSKNRKYR